MLPNSPTLCGSHCGEVANEKECFNMLRSLKRGEGLCQDPSSQSEKRGIHIQDQFPTEKGESEKNNFATRYYAKRRDDGDITGKTENETQNKDRGHRYERYIRI
jgi:hypothetical protein